MKVQFMPEVVKGGLGITARAAAASNSILTLLFCGNTAGLEKLQRLSLSGHQSLTSQGLMVLANMTALKYLDLAGCGPHLLL